MADVWKECMDYGVEVVKHAGEVTFSVFSTQSSVFESLILKNH